MLLDIPAAQHQNDILHSQWPLCSVMSYLYRGPGDATTALHRDYCVRHHTIIGSSFIFSGKIKKPTEVGGGALRSLTRAGYGFTLLFGFVQRFIDAHHQLIQWLHIPFPEAGAEGDRQAIFAPGRRSTFTAMFPAACGRYRMFGRKDHRELFAAVAIEGDISSGGWEDL